MTAPLPHSIQHERHICGALMIAPYMADEVVATGLKESDFYRPDLGRLYALLCERMASGQPVDMWMIVEAVAARSDRSLFPRFDELSSLGDTCPSTENAPHIAAEIVASSFKRRGALLLRGLAEVYRLGHLTTDLLLERTERALQGLAGGVGGESSWTSGDDLASLMWDDLQTRREAALRGERLGISWGIPEMEELPPMEPGRMYLLAARPGMGKSSMALQILHETVRRGLSVGLFNLEMQTDGVGRKILGLATGVSTSSMRDGRLTASEWARVEQGCNALSQQPLYIDTAPAQTIEQICSKARRLASKLRHTDRPLSLLMVDYAQLIRSSAQTPTERMAAVSQSLLALGKELNVPVLALAQLNRKVEERADKRPGLADLRGSGQWEQDAHAVLFLYREAAYNPLCEHNDTELLFPKWRDHRPGSLSLSWDGDTQRFGSGVALLEVAK